MAKPRRDDFPNHFVGDLVPTERGWEVVPATCCPDGHAWVNRLALRIRSLGTPVCGDYWDWGWSMTTRNVCLIEVLMSQAFLQREVLGSKPRILTSQVFRVSVDPWQNWARWSGPCCYW